MDKTGPSAFNLPVWWSLNRARDDGSLAAYLDAIGDKGAVVEIWDVNTTTVLFWTWRRSSAVSGIYSERLSTST
jgi:fructose 1,6-bisphosphatase